MNESISDAILDSGEESILRAYAGLSITAGGVSLQRSELPQSVTVAGALSTEGESSPVVSGDNVSDEAESLTFDELKNKLNIGDDVTSTCLADKHFDPRTDTGIPVFSGDNVSDEAESLTFDELKNKLNIGDDVTSTCLADKHFDPRTDTGIPVRDSSSITALNRSEQDRNVSSFVITGETDQYGTYGYIPHVSGLTWSNFTSSDEQKYAYAYILTSSDVVKIVDAEKYNSTVSSDENMCWAANAADMLYQTGWFASNVRTEDSVLDYYRSNFSRGDSYGGSAYYGLEWYLSGVYQPLESSWNGYGMCSSNTGGVFASNIENLGLYLSSSSQAASGTTDLMDEIVFRLQDNATVGISIKFYAYGYRIGGHALTVQGYTYSLDNSGRISYKGIIVSDSDDDRISEPSSAPNVWKVIPISWHDGYYWVDSNYSPVPELISARIQNATYLYAADFTTLSSGGAVVSSAATLLSKTVGVSEAMNVSSAGLAMDTTVTSGGIQTVLANGTALDSIVSSGGTMSILSGGTANDTVVDFGGKLIVSGVSGGSTSITLGGKTTVAGQMIIESGANVSAASGAIVDFDISDHVSIQTALVSDLSLIQGAPGYTLTVSSSTGSGLYRLAGNASGFGQTVSVFDAGETTSSGTLTLSQRTNIEGVNYLLNNADNLLTVFVTKTQTIHPDYFNGHFSGGTGAIFAKQSGNTVNFYAGGSSWGSSLALGSGWDALGAGDFNGDGKDDVLRINADGDVGGEFSNGNGTFSSQSLNFLNDGWSILGIGDFNGNNTADVLVANPTAANSTTGLVGYWESGSTWTLIGGSELEWQIVATGDFNADGKCDTLWRNSFIGELDGRTYNAYYTWITGEPLNGSHWRMVSVANPAEWNFLCSGDFNGDGTDDVALINGSGEVGVWGIDNGYLDSWSILNAVNNPDEWTFGGVGDFDADGWDDIAWCNNSTNSVNYWSTYNIQIDPDNNNGNNWKTIGTIA